MSLHSPLHSLRAAIASPTVLASLTYLALLLIGVRYPYGVDQDLALPTKSVLEWNLGTSPLPNVVTLVSPEDLSRDTSIWLSWWAPAPPFGLAPLIWAGVPVGTAFRLLLALAGIVGLAGWTRVARDLGCGRTTQLILGISLAVAIFEVTGADEFKLHSGEYFAFAAAPWPIAAIIAARSRLDDSSERSALMLTVAAGLLLGATYAAKYSAFVALLGPAAWFSLDLWRSHQRKSLLPLALFAVGAAVVPLALSILNWSMTGHASALAQLDATGIPASALQLWKHVAYYAVKSPGTLFIRDVAPLIAPFGENPGWLRVVARLALELGATSAVLLLSYRVATRQLFRVPRLTGITLVAPAIGLAVLGLLSFRLGFDPLMQARYLMPIAPLVYIGLLEGTLREERSTRFAWSAAVVVSLLWIPNLICLGKLPRNLTTAKYMPHASTRDGLRQGSIAHRQPDRVLEAIADLRRSPKDVLLLGTFLRSSEADDGLLAPMLASNLRPLVPARWGPLASEPAFRNADRVDGKFTTSKPLRVIAMVPLTVARDAAAVDAVLARFPQAGQWFSADVGDHANVAVWYSDLRADED